MGVQNTVAAVGAFAAESQFGALAVKFCSPLNQLLDAPGGILDQDFGGFGIAEAIAGLEGVLKVQTDFVFIAESGGDAALCPLGIGVRNFALGEDRDRTGGGEVDGSAQAGNSGADYQKISLGGHGSHEQKWYHLR